MEIRCRLAEINKRERILQQLRSALLPFLAHEGLERQGGERKQFN